MRLVNSPQLPAAARSVWSRTKLTAYAPKTNSSNGALFESKMLEDAR
jgi:hypothetical protein